MAEPKRLSFGLRDIPEGVTRAWGARLIWPDDLLHDRTSWMNGEHDVDLMAWLNGGALRSALTRARELADTYELRPSDGRQVTLFEDETGVVKANPQGSHGYLYVAAWMK